MPEISYVIKYNLNQTVEEAYKALRANIQFCESSKKIKTIAITSYSPGEGKSTTSINLGISMAKAGMNVLYVDADIRKPMPFKYFMSSNLKGLTNYILGQATLEDVINKTDIDGFSFITCGIKVNNPGELITSNRFSNFIREVRELYDTVIIDTPPLGSVIDAAVVAAQVDGTIIVIEANAVKCQNAIRMKEQLIRANANILGVVLNKINKSEYKSYYGSYDYYNSQRKYLKKWSELIKDLKREQYD
ncbi:CpsD/CapB family tyrosine-protein kinase [Acetivibrio clariflavus]|uniref:non-specific protein-tyrosine kinase n=1 Tax=Acetivibrio clariflavus (strain DSM 19732 / NBRC 101661 / EBR45) TaxID=720554 RepID=G8LX30_ACECE|nr:CpsD/CapB family tyrosine-protein kinase [Acetivibrio clariflavus]AEV67682.1 capsular exopolysaccharide biosynthesis protein [Acetivibrio clariflavus DSM 19732]HOP99644.1 CpsD/CapB family tyrosine-protein kinase [Acetivibrio clariflavus]HPU40919.1 CpsD/CapB family tyrosine-protein kinase [Acetivibrio clariflavus]